jgi:hypothetical protein
MGQQMQPNKKVCQVLLPDTYINLQLLIIIKNFTFIVKKEFSIFGASARNLGNFDIFAITQSAFFAGRAD